MNKAEKLKAWALSKVGSPYVMGGTGKACTPAYRKARAAQYPGSAANIKKYCPRMSGKQSTCDGCKYQGKDCYDCAQLVRWGCQAAGIAGLNISGATSQWNRGEWAEKGELTNLPEGVVCILYRRDDSNTMGHTGICLGDGTIVHAKSTAAGVVHDQVSAGRWTHYAIPLDLDMEGEADEVATDIVAVYRVTSEVRLALRMGRSRDSERLAWIPHNAFVDALEEPADGWVRVRYEGRTGYCMTDYLSNVEDEPEPEDEAPTESPAGNATGNASPEMVSVRRDLLESMKALIESALAE